MANKSSKLDRKNNETIEKKHKSVEKVTYFSLLKDTDFSALFFGGFIANIGDYFTSIAIIFLIIHVAIDLPSIEVTRFVALLTTFSLLPNLLIAPIAGVFVDKWNRKKVLYITDLVFAFTTIGLYFAYKIWHIYVLAIILSSARQFFYPAKTASIPKITGKKKLLVANGMIQTSYQISRVLGPLMAGFVTVIFNLRIAFLITAISHIISSICIMTIHTDLSSKKQSRITLKTVITDLGDGFRLTFTDKIISFVVITFGFVILALGMIDPLIVPYMSFEFGLTEKEFGILMSLSAISGIIVSVVFSIKGKIDRKLTVMTTSIVLLSISISLIGLAAYIAGGIIWLFVGFSLIGMINVGFNMPFSTLLQRIAKNKDLGKISSIIDTTLTTASLIASTLAVILSSILAPANLFLGVSLFIFICGMISLLYIKAKGLERISLLREKSMLEAEEEQDEQATYQELTKIEKKDTDIKIEEIISPVTGD